MEIKDAKSTTPVSSTGQIERPVFKNPKVEGGLFEQIQADREITDLLQLANEHLGVIGYTEHGLRHANRVASYAGMLLRELGHPSREVDFAMVAGYLHDIGNFIGRTNHGQTGAAVLYTLLQRYKLSNRGLGLILSAVGNHEEQYGQVLNNICAAVVIADKSDVHRSRVRHYDPTHHDIHDAVNYAVTKCNLWVEAEGVLCRTDGSNGAGEHAPEEPAQLKESNGFAALREIHLELQIDHQIASVMDYFQIFLSRMEMCRGASQYLGCGFRLRINNTFLT
jgi:metal-dependent HD superfamily phosphatase/phosphodiesterase